MRRRPRYRINDTVVRFGIRGIQTYLVATVIIWITTSISDVIARQMIRSRRRERR